MLRTIDNVKLNDRVSTKSLLDKNKTLSVNQTMAQIKITEMLKSVNTENNPLHFKPKTVTENERTTRSITNGMMEIEGHSTLSRNTFIEDSKQLWNIAPEVIKKSKTLAKKEIKKFCTSLPI